ncbi:hypothetical protein [Sphingomonas sp.]|uniref:hypothetical protein n=1 Tax=Sphingomonas sp. TaxID=28214 RepID=UPI002BAE585F|nr:hypothetical protein [Sphingomonas sp.]HTG37340.1 hypothetical protein [Sphingomonas sp.]
MSRPMILILSDDDPARANTATQIVSAHAALGAPTRLHLDGTAVRVLASSVFRDGIVAAQALGARISACPTGLAEHGIDPDAVNGSESIGLVALFAEMDDHARLVVL